MRETCSLGHKLALVDGSARCPECTRNLTKPAESAPVRGSITRMVDGMRAAIDQRDEAEANARGVTVDALREAREQRVAKDAERELREQRRERLGRDARLIKPADVERIISADPTALNGTKAWRVVERFLRSRREFCVLSGPKGVGKTVAACAAKSRLGGLIVSADELTRACKNEHAEAIALRSRITDVAFLVIDDIGLELDEVAGIRALQWAVNERQGPGMKTLGTTNLSKKMIVGRYDARTIERIEHGGAIVELEGESLRRKAS